ncbi:MAG: hypothetical protein O2962_09275, partial [Cyanobacteria bacterium]|nr:hypothetical protein [Cyanobacteriota bacterium]
INYLNDTKPAPQRLLKTQEDFLLYTAKGMPDAMIANTMKPYIKNFSTYLPDDTKQQLMEECIERLPSSCDSVLWGEDTNYQPIARRFFTGADIYSISQDPLWDDLQSRTDIVFRKINVH